MRAIDVETLNVVATATRGNNSGDGLIDYGQVSQLNDIIYVGQRAVQWTGSDLVAAQGGGIEVIVDQFERRWAYNDNYEGDTPKQLQSLENNKTIPISEEAKNSFNDQPSSVSGSGIAYKNFAFTSDYVLHKFQ